MTLPTKDDLTAKNLLLYICIALFGLLALTIIMKLLPVAIFLFLFLAPPIFVLSDAQERRVHRPILWGIFTLFTSVFGLVVYLLVRPDKLANRFCSHCNGSIEEEFTVCPWCGKEIEKVINKCPKCSTDIKKGWRYCPSCQTEINKPAPETKNPTNGDTAVAQS